MLTDRLKNAIEILEYALKFNTSVNQACLKFNRATSYVRHTKAEFKNKNDKDYLRFVALYKKAVTNSITNFQASKIEVEETIDNFLDDEFHDHDTPIVDEEVGTKSKTASDGNVIELDYLGNKIIKTADELIAETGVDLSIFKIDREVVNKWDVSMKDKDTGKVLKSQNFQVKVWLSKIRTEEEQRSWEYFLNTIKEYAPQYKQIQRSDKTKKYCFELSLPDLHIGKMAWYAESGEDYDTKIAIERYTAAIDELINHIELIKDEVGEILLPIGNDLFNVDNFRNETTHGTRQDVDSRWQRMFLKGKEMLIKNIDKLREIAPVKILMVSGNHDNQTIFYLGESLRAWYRNVDDVDIDNSPAQRKYYTFGLNLIAFTHGNEEKHFDLGMIMANERPHLWGATKFRSIHLGHYHKKKQIKWVDTDEFQGFKVKILPSLSGSDAWHSSKGYSSQRAAIGMLHHYNKGLLAEYTYTVV
jgi:hypothetical protein